MTSLRQLSSYRFSGKREQAIREEWLAPLLVHLGYGVETLNEIRYEVPLRLAKPFRRIGRTRVEVDYLPTVLGHGLWIIEAKAAESEDWDDALSQAWLYATHPEVNVPFMVIADGSRFAVYDTQKPDWDVPEIDISTREIEQRFQNLSSVLGAANVTRAIRERRVRHLGTAMRAEIDVARLREYVGAVQELADEARPAVLENYRSILRDQHAAEEQRQQEALEEAGLFAVGVWANRPVGVAMRTMGMGRDAFLREPPEDRRAAFDRLIDASRYGRPPVPRQFWNLRLVRLFVALTCADEDGCEFLRNAARTMVRDHLLNFPDDGLLRAHRPRRQGRGPQRRRTAAPTALERRDARANQPSRGWSVRRPRVEVDR
jgi:hypothetical protein